ncbi:MAG: hypothetical protein ACI9CO_000026 [Candidatus Azotimanducaceae bacterium]|jgi:hypothetical protein
MQNLPNYGTFGYGYDVTSGVARKLVQQWDYTDGNSFQFRGIEYAVPNNVVINPSPGSGQLESSLVMVSRDINATQVQMAQTVGLEIDKAKTKLGEFSRTSKIQNEKKLFDEALMIYTQINADYSYFTARLTDSNVDPALVELAGQCAATGDFRVLFEKYGTHCVTTTPVGGQMSFSTSVQADKIDNSRAVDAELSAQTTIDYKGITAESDTSLNHRSADLSSTYKENTSRSQLLRGGDITVDTLSEWKHSLDNSKLPGSEFVRKVRGRASKACMVKDDLKILDMSVVELKPLSNYLEGEVRLAFETAVVQYIDQYGISGEAKTRKPSMGGSADAGEFELSDGETAKFGGWWMADNEIEIGLEALPGSTGTFTITHPLHSTIQKGDRSRAGDKLR